MNAGMGLTPPPALTPKSWNHTSGSLNGSSLSAGAGQVGTQVVRGGRSKVIATVAGLCVAAGVGGSDRALAQPPRRHDARLGSHGRRPAGGK